MSATNSGFTPGDDRDRDEPVDQREARAAAALADDPRRDDPADVPPEEIVRPSDIDVLRAGREAPEPDGPEDYFDAGEAPDAVVDKTAVPMSAEQAESELDAMLAAKRAPAPRNEIVRMPELCKRLNADRAEDGLPPLKEFKVELRALHDKEIEAISQRSERKPTKEQRERGLVSGGRDLDRWHRLVVAEGIVSPDFKDARMLERHHKPENAVIAWFLPGEIIQLSDVVTDLSGWGTNAVVRAGK